MRRLLVRGLREEAQCDVFALEQARKPISKRNPQMENEMFSPDEIWCRRMGSRRHAYAMKEVRASVYSARALRAASGYPGTLPTGRRMIESSGLTDRRDGSNVSMSPTGMVEREPFGVARWIFVLKNQVVGKGEKEERGYQSLSRKRIAKPKSPPSTGKKPPRQ